MKKGVVKVYGCFIKENTLLRNSIKYRDQLIEQIKRLELATNAKFNWSYQNWGYLHNRKHLRKAKKKLERVNKVIKKYSSLSDIRLIRNQIKQEIGLNNYEK